MNELGKKYDLLIKEIENDIFRVTEEILEVLRDWIRLAKRANSIDQFVNVVRLN